MKLYDITLPIRENMPIWPGQPEVKIEPLLTVAKDGAMVSRFSFSSHTGTHVDAPAHFLEGGTTADALSLDRLIGPARVLDLTLVETSVDVSDLEPFSIKRGERILLKTKNSGYLLKKAFHESYVPLSCQAANYLVDRQIKLIGIDYLGIEKRGSPGHSVHKVLLSHGIVIVEGLYLSEVSAGEYELFCLPLKIERVDGAPARVILIKR